MRRFGSGRGLLECVILVLALRRAPGAGTGDGWHGAGNTDLVGDAAKAGDGRSQQCAYTGANGAGRRVMTAATRCVSPVTARCDMRAGSFASDVNANAVENPGVC